ncbi:MAG: MarR family transcriptional regulator [Bacteroidota bacterium]
MKRDKIIATRPNEHSRAYFKLLETANWIEMKVKEVLNNYQLTHAQFNILMILRENHPEPVSAGDLKEKLIFKNSDVTRLLDRMVKKGMVERYICPSNRRKLDITISGKAMEMLELVVPEITVAVEHFYRNKITAEEAIALTATLNKIRN